MGSQLQGGTEERQLHFAQDSAKQSGSSGEPDDGGEGAGLHLRDGRRPRQADQGDQRGHRAAFKHPELFDALGIAQPKGVLLYGPPGTGKTLLARAVAHHTECTFIRVSGSELVQKFIGEGSRMVRELFVMAREHAPPSSSWTRSTPSDPLGSSPGVEGTVRFKGQCWSCSTSWMALRPLRTSR